MTDRVKDRMTDRSTSGRSALALVVFLVFVPITVLRAGDGLTLVMQWGFLSTAAGNADGTFQFYPLWRFFADQPYGFGRIPASIRVWPLALAFHLLATASAAVGVVIGREDRRVTGGLLVLAALATLWVAAGLAGRFGVGHTAGWFSVLPVGGLAALGVALGVYGGDLRRMFR